MAARTCSSFAVSAARLPLCASARALRAAARRPSPLFACPSTAAAAPPSARSFSVAARLKLKKYTEDHEWIEVDETGQYGRIGISKYAADALGDVVFVELPTTDSHVNTGDSIGAVESVKSASDIMTPVAGTVTEVNSELEENPKIINQSPEADGWICRIELSDKEELNALMDESAYQTFVSESAESH